jgi:uncharacterized membrane protein YdjX (TVP38/TMEM64 family)
MKKLGDRYSAFIWGGLFIVGGITVWWLYGDQLGSLIQDREALQAFVTHLGWWGPIGLIIINITQIVIAPIPGYAVYVVAGWLYNWLWGGVWGSTGLLLGGMTAMTIGRNLGRPIVQRLIGVETLARWESIIHSDSILVWGVILLSPIGDAPFLLAGLSQVGFLKILALTIITRVPAAFLAAALGAGAVVLTWWQIMLITLALALPMGLTYRYQTQIMDWFEERARRLAEKEVGVINQER